jgi:hypothetical protein
MRLSRFLVTPGVLVTLLVGCNEPPLILAVDVDDASRFDEGPEDVRFSARSDDGFGAARLIVIDGRPTRGGTPVAIRGADFGDDVRVVVDAVPVIAGGAHSSDTGRPGALLFEQR